MIILGGTFDPPHIGHLVAAECARHQFGEQRVVFMPAGDPYRKTRDAGLAVTPAPLRLAMLRLAIADNDGFDVDDREARREGPTYTIDTLRALASEGVTQPVVVFGADAVLDMPNWKEPAEIAAMCRIAVAPKPRVALHDLPPRGTWLDMPLLDVSGTAIRQRVRDGHPIRYLVPRIVEEFIAGRGLYRVPGRS